MVRLIDTPRESVYIDGIDICDFDVRHLREVATLVPQDPHLFSATLRENLTYDEPGRPGGLRENGAMSNSEKSEPAFEEALAELEALVERMEEGDLSLEESIKTYERGVALGRSALKSLDVTRGNGMRVKLSTLE